MPFPDTSFDIVISVEVMEHVANLDSYLNDIHRLLKPEGTFIWTTPCANRFSIEHIVNVITKQAEKTNKKKRKNKKGRGLIILFFVFFHFFFYLYVLHSWEGFYLDWGKG